MNIKMIFVGLLSLCAALPGMAAQEKESFGSRVFKSFRAINDLTIIPSTSSEFHICLVGLGAMSCLQQGEERADILQTIKGYLDRDPAIVNFVSDSKRS